MDDGDGTCGLKVAPAGPPGLDGHEGKAAALRCRRVPHAVADDDGMRVLDAPNGQRHVQDVGLGLPVHIVGTRRAGDDIVSGQTPEHFVEFVSR